MDQISYSQFEQVDIRIGTIVKIEEFPKARNPSYKLWADFGPEYNIKQTSAQVTDLYKAEDLVGKQILGVLNLGTRNIAGFISEFLILGIHNELNQVSLATFEHKLPNGKQLL